MQKLKTHNLKTSKVLNLIINGLPSKHTNGNGNVIDAKIVLNLIINGLPSKQKNIYYIASYFFCFKPYYKWITF